MAPSGPFNVACTIIIQTIYLATTVYLALHSIIYVMPCCHDNHNTVIELAMQRRAAFSWAGQKAMRSLRSLKVWTNPSSTAKKCSATEDCCRNPGGDRRPSSTVKYCSATGLLPNRQRGERPGVNGLPFSHRRKETPVFNNLELLVNRRLRQNRRKRDKPVFNS